MGSPTFSFYFQQYNQSVGGEWRDGDENKRRQVHSDFLTFWLCYRQDMGNCFGRMFKQSREYTYSRHCILLTIVDSESRVDLPTKDRDDNYFSCRCIFVVCVFLCFNQQSTAQQQDQPQNYEKDTILKKKSSLFLINNNKNLKNWSTDKKFEISRKTKILNRLDATNYTSHIDSTILFPFQDEKL